ncbi:unnamed protein product [Ambrosiozyma monospora]|uniref:Unnamed protein product n=1 Tax=Ambrosiozyma monospora TaxID=43982 RepID=A0ACB5U6P2_AMBMO|nr:unnamed protein product [Ambrosiozyma monospora]
MKIISRFIQALKYQLFDDDMLPILHDSMLILINCNPTPDSIRAISLYIVYALTQADNNTTDSQSKDNANRQFTCGLSVLDVLVTLVCNGLPNSNPQLHKTVFQSINIKWIVLLLNNDDPRVIKGTLRLLLKTLTLLGKKAYRRFIDAQGLSILQNTLQGHWEDNPDFFIILLTGVFGISYFPEFGSDFVGFVNKLASKGARFFE